VINSYVFFLETANLTLIVLRDFRDKILEKDLITDLEDLQGQLDGMVKRVNANGATLQRFQIFEKELFNLNSLAEMLEYVLNAQEFFDLDYIGFCIIDEKGELKNYLSEDGFNIQTKPRLIILASDEVIQTTFGRSTTPYLGAYKTAKCANFFAYGKYKPASVAIIPLVRRGKYLGTLSMGSMDPQRFVDTMATDFIEHLAAVVGICLENHLNFAMMNRRSLIDTLTGVNNRYFLEQRLGEEVSRSQRSIEPLSCLFLDIDWFKKVNDTYGHLAGDQVLISVTAVIREQLRNNDILVRYTGEKFIAVLANIDQQQGYEVAERIRLAVQDLAVSTTDSSISVTISIGCSTYKPSHSSQLKAARVELNLIQKAEKALYKAKSEGKNRVVSANIMTAPVFLANLFNRS